MRPFFRASLILAALALSPAWPSLAEPVHLTFVQTNDIDRMEERDGRGGFARVAAVVKAERAKGPTLFIHSGDTISPSLLSGIDKGAHVIDILNHMSVDVMTPGNHEFDFGPDVFRERMKQATFPIVTSNIREPDGSQPANTLDEKIVTLNGIKIGFYGLTTEDTRAVSSPGDITFAPSVQTGAAKAKALRAAGVDLVVAVVHTPLSVDMLLVRNGSADLVLSGHDEHLLAFYDGKAVLTESEAQGNYAVITELAVDKSEANGVTSVKWWPNFRIVDTATVTPDPDIAALVKTYTDKLDVEMKVPIGKTTTPLDSRRATVRGEEAAIGNLIADAIRAAVGADIGFVNGGGIRADKQYEPGPLTRGDIFAELPFGNRTVKLEVTGATVLKALENGFSQARQLAGRFPQLSGLVVEVDMSAPPGSRVLSVTIGGRPLDAFATYTLATNDFVARGGDGYTALADAKSLINPIDAQLMAGQVIDYIAKAGTISPGVEGRILVK